ncbi:MAG: RNA-directed DNA polymerase [Lentisphaerae bacterium]|nr:RNA-directed DNA polymerase [Lentisphaerota bacterium]
MDEQIDSTADRWVEHLGGTIKSRPFREACTAYASRLVENGFPVVFNLQHLAKVTGLKTRVVGSQVFRTERYYRKFSIPKRTGGLRTIHTPYPSLLLCQRWINYRVLTGIRVHKHAHGFVSGRSVLSNALPHLQKRWMLKMDIKDFFPSISIRRIVPIFRRCGYSRDVSYFLSRQCCLEDVLPQGAATSPTLSNIVLKRTDSRLTALAESFAATYTRYADDLTFSGDYLPARIIDIVSRIVTDEGFRVNTAKTRLVGPKGRKIVTGVSVSGASPRLPRQTKRVLRQELFHLHTKGYAKHTAVRQILDPLYAERLLGKLSFWLQIEPDSPFARQALDWMAEVRGTLQVLGRHT